MVALDFMSSMVVNIEDGLRRVWALAEASGTLELLQAAHGREDR